MGVSLRNYVTYRIYFYIIYYLTASQHRDGENRFLFVHQSVHQKHLMERYGDELIMLDATYRTMKYAVPLFLVVVPTNDGYQVVMTFITETESKEDIVEALQIIAAWNPSVQPRHGMTD